MATTYEPIATQTLSAAAASVTFSAIPATYTDLVLVFSAIATSGNNCFIQFNGDTGTNYSFTNLYGTGATAGSARSSATAEAYTDYYGNPSTTPYNVEVINIMNYSNTTTNKTFISRASRADRGTDLVVGLWRNTAAITSLLIDFTGGPVFSAGSTFSLYGIKAA